MIREITSHAEANVFFDLLNRLVISRHGLTPVPRTEYEAAFENVYRDPAAGVIFGAYHGDVFLGGLLLYRSRTTAHARRYVADALAAQAVGNLRVAPALWLEGMLWAKRQGCGVFDVEGSAGSMTSTTPRSTSMNTSANSIPRTCSGSGSTFSPSTRRFIRPISFRNEPDARSKSLFPVLLTGCAGRAHRFSRCLTSLLP